MTSAINPGTISTTFPVAGQDNDSQGFRSNFAAIAAQFTEAATELTALQAVSVLTSDLATQSEPVVNNMLGSTLYNGQNLMMSSTVHSQASVSGAINIDVSLGTAHYVTLSGVSTLTFINWPTYTGSTVYTEIQVILLGTSSTVITPTFATANSGTIVQSTSWSLSVSNASHVKLRVWTMNGGTTVFMDAPQHFAA
jgi:hypothetical protein